MAWKPARVADLHPGRWVRGRYDGRHIEGTVVGFVPETRADGRTRVLVAVEPEQRQARIFLSNLRVNR